jgi:hypothetical protein
MHIDIILGSLSLIDIAMDYLWFPYRYIHIEIVLGYLWSPLDTHIQIQH